MKKQQVKIEEIKSLVRGEAQRYLEYPNVNSVGIGYKVKSGKITNELCVQFTVDKKSQSVLELIEMKTTEIPKVMMIDGKTIKTDVIERKYDVHFKITRKLVSIDRKLFQDPMMPGISIGNEKISAGTLGCIVYDKLTGKPCILSNWHVLQGEDGIIGDNIVQPGPFDNNCKSERNIVGKLLRSHLDVAGDCAVAEIDNRTFNANIFEMNVIPKRIGEVELDDKVMKSGRTTGITHGIVKRISVTTKINYGSKIGIKKIGCFEIGVDPNKPAANNEISMGGDSGSVYMIKNKEGGPTDILVGLHFAGESPDSDEEHALACYAHNVFNKLEISLDKPSDIEGVQEQLKIGYDKNFLSKSVAFPSTHSIESNKILKVGTTNHLDYVHYSVAMNKERRMAFYSICNVDGNSLKRVPRITKWVFDSRIDSKYQIGNDIYINNKLDKGHLTRRLDVVWGSDSIAKKANADTFYYTNACPQHANFNQKIWNDLEEWILDNADVENLKISIITGPVLYDNDREYRSIKIPKEFWKIVVMVRNRKLTSLAFLMTQADMLNNLEAFDDETFKMYQVPITTIETLTRLDFGPLRNADTQYRVPEALGINRINSFQDIKF